MSNNKDAKPQIKLNRKMRLWNKYRTICIMAVVVIVVVIMASVVVKRINSDNSGSQGADIALATTTAAAPETTAAEQTTAAQEQTTAADTSSVKLKLAGTAAAEQFTQKDFYTNTVFMGDSIVSGISSYGYLTNVVGNVNATSAKLQSYVDEAMSSNPSKVFIMVGHNDANYGTIKAETLAENITEIAAAIHQKNSSTKVYVLSLTPITTAYEKKTSVNVAQSYLDSANSLIESNASASTYTYIDVASAYKDNSGYMSTEYTGNGINLTTSYYPFLLNGIAEVAK